MASALAQHDASVEVIVVDDGSTDDPRGALARHGLLDRVVWISQPNGGVSAARNTGLEATRGRYVCFLDSDDLLDPRFARAMMTLLQTRGGRFAYCNYRYFNDTPARPTLNIRYPIYEGLIAAHILTGNFIPTPGTVLLERSFLGSLRFDSAHQGTEDWWMWIQLGLREPLYYHSECLVHIRVRPNSLGRRKVSMVRETAMLFDRSIAAVSTGAVALSRREEARVYYRAASAMVDASRTGTALRHWARAARLGLGLKEHGMLLGKSLLRAAGALRSVERLLWHRRVGG